MILDVPAFPCVVHATAKGNVFDAWGWCESDRLEWRLPTSESKLALGAPIEGHNPPGLAFVMYEAARKSSFLPTELARLHAFGYGFDDRELALAPWAIDDATDLLYEQRARPRDIFWVAAATLDALVWGLHDWAHFHNHGPFDQPAMTELQCDLIALAWLRLNADRLGVDPEAASRVARQLAALSRKRFDEEEVVLPSALDLDALFDSPYPTRQL